MISNLNEYLEQDILNLLGESSYEFVYDDDLILLRLASHEKLLETLRLLRDHKLYKFKILIDLFCVDYPENAERFEINYNLLSLHNNYRINIKVLTGETKKVPSIVSFFSAAQWFEREIWDMYGVAFTGNDDLRRILTDYNFEGHPLRKDFPLTGYKEVKYDPKKKQVIYQDVSLAQEFRTFDFESPWTGGSFKGRG